MEWLFFAFLRILQDIRALREAVIIRDEALFWCYWAVSCLIMEGFILLALNDRNLRKILRGRHRWKHETQGHHRALKAR